MKINFESSTACNSDCVFCPRSKITRPKGEMSDELFHKIIKEGKEMGVTQYSPFLNGEPFVFSRIWKWLDYMEKEGVKFSLYTNAEFLDAERLSRYKNVWYVNCSLNAATPETYAKVMRKPKWDTVIKNIDELVKKAPFFVRVSFVKCDENIHELEQFKSLPYRKVICGYDNWTGDKTSKLERGGEKRSCWTLSHQMSILWDGTVVPCCMDYNAKQVLGDANKQTLKEIWGNAHWMRRMHREGRWGEIPVCKDCNYNTKNLRGEI
jgi:radical SAM protein with 4Fe4S-binding SPASM domain